MAGWTDRKTQIYPAEVYALFAAVWEHRFLLAGADVLAFVDNEAAAAAIIRGAPRHNDVGDMVHCLHWTLLRHGVRPWVEWIDSDSNPSDGLSRDGLLDKWTLEQGWDLRAGSHPPTWSANEAVKQLL